MAASSPNMPMRRQFSELHPKDQTTKLNRKARIEANWSCDIQTFLPEEIRPRVELKKGAKARLGDVNIAEEVWWNWSVELLRGLEELSTMTSNKLDFAQELLGLEVSLRQQNPKHPQRKLVELLLGDVQRIIDGMRRTQQALAMGEYEDENANENEDGNTTVNPTGPLKAMGTTDFNDYEGNDVPGSAGHLDNAPANTGASASGQSADMDVRVVELRARGLRLRAQATRLDAEAATLESDAAELRAQIARESKSSE